MATATSGDKILIDLPDAKANENVKFRFDVALDVPGICEGEPARYVLRVSLDLVKKIVADFNRFLQ